MYCVLDEFSDHVNNPLPKPKSWNDDTIEALEDNQCLEIKVQKGFSILFRYSHFLHTFADNLNQLNLSFWLIDQCISQKKLEFFSQYIYEVFSQ